jgi:hypothetical protein
VRDPGCAARTRAALASQPSWSFASPPPADQASTRPSSRRQPRLPRATLARAQPPVGRPHALCTMPRASCTRRRRSRRSRPTPRLRARCGATATRRFPPRPRLAGLLPASQRTGRATLRSGAERFALPVGYEASFCKQPAARPSPASSEPRRQAINRARGPGARPPARASSRGLAAVTTCGWRH